MLKKLKLEQFLDYRSCIMGIAILWIILFHSNIICPQNLVLKVLWYVFVGFGGGLGVNLFLFASGLALMFSTLKKASDNQIYFKSYFTKRVIRILPCYAIIAAIALLLKNEGIFNFLMDLSLISFWINGKRYFWYIAAILVLYTIFPLIYILTQKIGHEKTLILCLAIVFVGFEGSLLIFCKDYYDKIEVFIQRIPCFLYGCYVGYLIKENKIKKLWIFSLVLISFTIGFMAVVLIIRGLPLLLQRHLFSAFTPLLYICLIYIISYLPKINFNVFEYLGNRSLELYLVNVTFASMILARINNQIVAFVLYVLSNIIIAEIFYHLTNKNGVLIRKFKKR